jgi:CRP/FNR family transcriptional regulator, cyclic AMP receptor protein
LIRKNAKVELLKRIPLFALCSKADLAEVASIADEVYLPVGRRLTVEGEPGREFFVLVEGRVHVTRRSDLVEELEDGAFFGEISLVAKLPRTATVETVAPSRVLVIADRDFDTLLRDVPSIQVKVLRALAQRLAPESV